MAKCYTLPRNFAGKLQCLKSNQGTQLNEADVNNSWCLFESTSADLPSLELPNWFRPVSFLELSGNQGLWDSLLVINHVYCLVSSPIQCSSRDQFFFFFFLLSFFILLSGCPALQLFTSLIVIHLSNLSAIPDQCQSCTKNFVSQTSLRLPQHQYFRQTCHFGNVCCLG